MLDKIIEEASFSNSNGVLTNNELKGIYDIVNHVKDDLKNNNGNRANNAYEVKVAVMFSFNGEKKS